MSSLRNFGIALLVSLVLLSVGAYFAMGIVATLFDPESKENIEGENQEVQTYDPSIGANVDNRIKTGHSFNMLIIGTDYDPVIYDYSVKSSDKLTVPKRVEATAVLFVRFDKDKREICMSSIPTSTVVDVDFVSMELGKAYGYKGGSFIRDKVSGLTGLSIDYYFEFSGRDFMNYGPQTAFKAPIAMDVPAYKGLSGASFTEGQLLSGVSLYTYLHYNAQPVDRLPQRNEIVQNVFLQTMRKFATYDVDRYYKQISSFTTDMTSEDVAELIEVLNTLPLFIDVDEDRTKVTEIDFIRFGSFDRNGVFTPDREAAAAAFAEYK